jgi:hypothetical protein
LWFSAKLRKPAGSFGTVPLRLLSAKNNPCNLTRLAILDGIDPATPGCSEISLHMQNVVSKMKTIANVVSYNTVNPDNCTSSVEMVPERL